MDTTQIIILVSILAVIVIAGLAYFLYNRKSKKKDEIVVVQPEEESKPVVVKKNDFFGEKLNLLFLESGMYFEQLYIPMENELITEIPQVFFNSKGFFLFKYIDVSGWVLGREDSRWWTHFEATNEKRFLDNPIWNIEEYIDLLIGFFPKTKESDYHTYIVFSNQCELRSIEFWGNTRVVNERDFTRILGNDFQVIEDVFTEKIYYQMLRVLKVMTEADQLSQRLDALKKEMEAEKQIKDANMEITGKSKKREESRRLKHMRPEDCFTRPELALRDALIIWRKQYAAQMKITDFEVFDNRTLDSLVVNKPQKISELLMIPGMDQQRCDEYGNMLLSMIKHMPQA